MNTFFKILAAIFAGLFLYAVVVQHNDQDALKWYCIYGLAALASILFLLDKLSFIVSLVLCLVYVIGAFLVWPDQFEGVVIGEGDIVNIERGREALGLLIVAVVMLVYALRIKYTRKS